MLIIFLPLPFNLCCRNVPLVRFIITCSAWLKRKYDIKRVFPIMKFLRFLHLSYSAASFGALSSLNLPRSEERRFISRRQRTVELFNGMSLAEKRKRRTTYSVCARAIFADYLRILMSPR